MVHVHHMALKELRAETFTCQKNRKTFDKNFRWFLEQISREKFIF